MKPKKIPITLLSGNSGAGKSTLIRAVLSQNHPYRVALINLDMGSRTIDPALFASPDLLITTDERVISADDDLAFFAYVKNLMKIMMELYRSQDFDTLMIELSGEYPVDDVLQALLYSDDALSESLRNAYRIDSVVSLINALELWTTMNQELMVSNTENSTELFKQSIRYIESSNVVLLTHTEVMDLPSVQQTQEFIALLQPTARVIKSHYGNNLPYRAVLHTHLFDEEATPSPMEPTVDQRYHDEGLNTFVFRCHRPFHPRRLAEFFEHFPLTTLRTKGAFWVATQPDIAFVLSQVGSNVEISVGGEWIASQSPELLELIHSEGMDENMGWDSEYGDRINELLFIGYQQPIKSIRTHLLDCLYDEEQDFLDDVEDPFDVD